MSVPAPAVPAFDPAGALPSGVTVLEASAGTGKTFTIAALTARYVAEGVPLERMLVVTFTRMATGELRDRVRERLVQAEDGLTRALAGVAPPADDAVLGLLARGRPEEVHERRRLLARALAEFDAATITTIHGFCQQMLGSLGVGGDVERDVAFVEDVGDLVDQVADDLYARRFHKEVRARLGHAEARAIARAVVANPAARIEPATAAAEPDGLPGMRVRLAVAVRDELERRKRALALMTYDDLLTRLRDALADPGRGPAACARLRRRFAVALVDEFQDTDPVQWEVMRRAFGGGGGTLVLIGDPKQAIYAFRGAEVHAYLQAATAADATATLEVNWRSDQPLLDAYEALLGGARLGHPEIVHRRVRAAEGHRAPGLVGAPAAAPLRLRMIPLSDPALRLTKGGLASADSARRRVAEDVAADVARLLSSPARLARPPTREERLRPGHVAVLVRTNPQAALVRDALEAVGVPAVINGAGSVFAAQAATDWQRLLEALERPTSRARAATVALTPFLGWGADRVAAAGEADWEDLQARLHRWAALLRRRGLASLLETVARTQAVSARMLALDGGERALTDLRHVGQLLHGVAAAEQLGVTALAAWLRRRRREARDADEEEASRRLESDAEAVQVLTVHRSKGLEFPVVYCPYLWDPFHVGDDEPPVFHDPAAGERVIDVGGPGGPGHAANRACHVAERRGEELRLAYVALTRARHQAVVWWISSHSTRASPLARLLLAKDVGGEVAPLAPKLPPDPEMEARLRDLAAGAPGRIAVESAGGPEAVPRSSRPAGAGALRAGRFDRRLDHGWRRTSYSGITEGAHEARVASEPEHGVHADEGPGGPASPTAPPGRDEARLRGVLLPLGDLPSGVELGSLVHAVLERADFAAADLESELRRHLDAERARMGADAGDPAVAAAGLAEALRTPLGPSAGGLALAGLARADRLDELAFEMPLAGGDAPVSGLDLAAVSGLLAERLPAGDPLHGYADRLEDPALAQDLRGYLVGSIDLVARLPGPDGPRFAVIDYKTNRLGPRDGPVTAWHYRPEALAAEMMAAHYPLQALLYAAALHRYLRWRLPGYHPDRHLAGVVYLFLRGMCGRATPAAADGTPFGVFAWRPPAGLVPALSDLLDRGAAA